MTKHGLVLGSALLMMAVRVLPAQQTSAPHVVGTLATGATVSLIQSEVSGEWGIDVNGPGTPHVSQPQPARLEVFGGREAAGEYFREDIRRLTSGYGSVDTVAGGAIGVAELSHEPEQRLWPAREMAALVGDDSAARDHGDGAE